MGSVLPARIVSALSVGLYGMFLAIILPPARKSRVLAVIIVLSMLLSLACSLLWTGLSEGMRTVLLTVLIAGAAAALFPVKEAAYD